VALTADTTAKRGNGRRAPDVVKDLVLQAAHRLFSTQGYHGTKTRQIADEAGVGESVIFRNFGSKAELFEAAILTPFTDFVDRWAKTWDVDATSASDPAEIAHSFVKGFYNLAVERRELFQTLLAAPIQGGDPALAEVAARVSDKLADSLRGVQDVLLEHGAARHFRDVDTPVTVAFSVGSVMSLVLLDGWLFPPNQRRPGKARQIDEATRMLLYGVTGGA
jgi:AcrR family transcriptional regulator